MLLYAAVAIPTQLPFKSLRPSSRSKYIKVNEVLYSIDLTTAIHDKF